MNKKLEYKILDEQGLIIEYYEGSFSADELIDFKRNIGLEVKYDPCFNVISDIRSIDLLFHINEAQRYVDFLKMNKNYLGNRKTAMITRSPKQVVHSLGFNWLKGDLPIQYKIFSTFEAAYEFLQLNMSDQQRISNLFDQMKNES